MPGKSSSPAVSVIVPNFNHGSFLHQRIESILNQTYQDFELILIDDRSTDESREILETYRNHPKTAHLVFNENNSGSPFLQWEKGMQLAKGRYIWIAESDDWCEPSFLETLVPSLEADPEVRIAYCQSLCLDEQGKIKWVSKHSRLEQVLEGEEFVRRFMLKGNSIFNASMSVFRKAGLPESNHFTSYRFCGDWYFWIELALEGKVMISGKVLNYFRKHSRDVSSKAVAKGLYYTESTDILMIAMKKIGIQQDLLRELVEKRAQSFLKDEHLFESGEVKKAVLEKLKELDPSIVSRIRRLKAGLKLKNVKSRIHTGFKHWGFGGGVLL